MKPHVKTAFLTQLSYEVRPDGVSYLTKPLRFYSHRFERTWEAPREFPTDRASAELFGFKLIGKSESPWVGHDFLFANGEVGLLGAGLVLFDLMRAEGETKFKSAVFSLVATFHHKAVKAYRAHRRGNTAAAKFLRLLNGDGFASVENRP